VRWWFFVDIFVEFVGGMCPMEKRRLFSEVRILSKQRVEFKEFELWRRDIGDSMGCV
jgi:hypothetical protein